MKTDNTLNKMILIGWFLLFTLAANATKFVILVSNYQFNPASIANVSVGDTIHWEWAEGFHTTTSTAIPSFAPAWDEVISNSRTSFEYKVVSAGTYNYVCTPHASMGMTGSFSASIAGVGESPTSAIISIYPEPVKNSVTVSYKSQTGVLSVIKIYNISGKLILERKIENPLPNLTLDIDLSNLTSGLYLATFIDNRNNSVIRRVIKR